MFIDTQPHISVRDFADTHLEPILHKISQEKKECALIGDFNVDLLKSSGNNNTASDLLNNLSSFFHSFCTSTYYTKIKNINC